MSVTPIILASASPRRRQMLSWITDGFICVSADIDETPIFGEDPVQYCERLAIEKAETAAAQSLDQERLILASDTTVFIKDKIFGKPTDTGNAKEMLSRLQGRPHIVCTAVALLKNGEKKHGIITTTCLTTVNMRKFTETEIDDYIASNDPMGKAGAYAIQNREFHPAESIQGCYACVMGLPLCHTELLFTKFDMSFDIDFSVRCKAKIPHNCRLEKQDVWNTMVLKRKESELFL
ncbi:MAG: nucleoside triphosphate pyrophosphatase [Flexilinea sp.]